jgi:hypothetical protein
MIVIYEKGVLKPNHAIIYLEGPFIYHKAGSFFAPYGIQTLRNVLNKYINTDYGKFAIELRVFRRN